MLDERIILRLDFSQNLCELTGGNIAIEKVPGLCPNVKIQIEAENMNTDF